MQTLITLHTKVMGIPSQECPQLYSSLLFNYCIISGICVKGTGFHLDTFIIPLNLRLHIQIQVVFPNTQDDIFIAGEIDTICALSCT